jgi:hypothetical protein
MHTRWVLFATAQALRMYSGAVPIATRQTFRMQPRAMIVPTCKPLRLHAGVVAISADHTLWVKVGMVSISRWRTVRALYISLFLCYELHMRYLHTPLIPTGHLDKHIIRHISPRQLIYNTAH